MDNPPLGTFNPAMDVSAAGAQAGAGHGGPLPPIPMPPLQVAPVQLPPMFGAAPAAHDYALPGVAQQLGYVMDPPRAGTPENRLGRPQRAAAQAAAAQLPALLMDEDAPANKQTHRAPAQAAQDAYVPPGTVSASPAPAGVPAVQLTSTHNAQVGIAVDEATWLAAVDAHLASLADPATPRPRPIPQLTLDTYPPRAGRRPPPGEQDGMHTDSYQLESHVEGEMPILRRRDTDYVNGTKLLRLIPHSMTKGVRDNILRGTANRDAFVPPGLLRAGMSVAEATKNLPRKYQGVWIPLANARALAIRFDLLPYARTLLAPDPTEFLVPPSPQPSPGPEASDTESEGSLGLGLDADAPDPDDVLRGWRYERPARDSLAEKPYGWVRMSREMAAGNRGRVGRIT